MPHDINSTTHDKTQGGEFTGNISRTLIDATVTSMAECSAIQQGVMNIPTFNGKNMPVYSRCVKQKIQCTCKLRKAVHNGGTSAIKGCCKR